MEKKNIAVTLVITALTIVYFIVYFGFILTILEGWLWKVLLAVFPLAFSGVMIMVCLERIAEIRKGEEDDLGQY